MRIDMKGVVVIEPRRAVIQEMDTPVPKDDEVLIRVEVAGLCGSDLHIFNGVHPVRKPPVMPGHEVAGEVVETGKNVTRIKVGDRVTVEPNLYCGHCAACDAGDTNLCKHKTAPGIGTWGGTFAEYFTAPERCVYRIGESTRYESAVLTEPLAVAVHAVKRVGSGTSMLVMGSGTIGLMVTKVASNRGFKVYSTDIAAYNRETAMKMGAVAAWNPLTEDITENVNIVSGGRGMDAVVIAAAAPGILDQALALVANHAFILLLSMLGKPVAIDTSKIVNKEVYLTGTSIYTSQDFAEALKMIESGIDLSSIVTHKMPMSNIQRAFEMYKNKEEPAIKILVYPNQQKTQYGTKV